MLRMLIWRIINNYMAKSCILLFLKNLNFYASFVSYLLITRDIYQRGNTNWGTYTKIVYGKYT